MKKFTHQTVVGIFVVIGLAVVAYMTVKLGDVSLVGNNTYPLYAEFTSVSGLRPGNPVEVFGMEAGEVGSFRMDQENQVVVTELRIRNGVTIYDDAIASIKTAGLIGDKYVQITPGGAGAVLAAGDLIFDTESPTDLGDLIGKYAFGDVGKENAEEAKEP
jgi:phospholipid/cholesterol/gamma-HCH transport system substrate-binding protein